MCGNKKNTGSKIARTKNKGKCIALVLTLLTKNPRRLPIRVWKMGRSREKREEVTRDRESWRIFTSLA